jgi:hypothetical protein
MGVRRQSQIEKALEGYVKNPNHGAKLSEADVKEIRLRLADCVDVTTIARQYGVSYWTINNIKLGKRWRKVT